MLVRDKKHFVKGLLMLITFGILFCALLFPIMRDERGNHLTGLQYADNVFNELSKGSSNFIPQCRQVSDTMKGKNVSVSIRKFDSPEFIRLLEFIAQFPAKIDDNTIQEDTTALYRNGKALLARQSIGSFDEYVNLRYGTFGTDITMAGFPSPTPGTAAISPQLEIAINASSDEKDGCWKFVRRFLLDDYQNAIEMYWPVSISALDQLANEAMEPLYYIDENGNQVEDHIVMSIGGENIQLPRVTDAEVDQMYAFLKGLSSAAYFDSSVENIIAEESAAFFEGQKSAKDVAGVIQSRVQIYINENS